MIYFGEDNMGWLSDLFGGEGAGEEANKRYQEYMKKAEDAIRSSKEQGRTDISQGLKEGLGYTQPYREGGERAEKMYESSMGLGDTSLATNAFKTSLGYQFALEQGLQGVGANAAARGLAGSGAQAKELTRYGQGMADQEYGNWQNRLSGLSSLGAQLGSEAGQETIGTGKSLAGLEEWGGDSLANIYGEEGQSAAESYLRDNQSDLPSILGMAGTAAGIYAGTGGFRSAKSSFGNSLSNIPMSSNSKNYLPIGNEGNAFNQYGKIY